MTDHKRTETLSTRVDRRTLRLAQTVAELRHTTLSRFVADAVERAVYEGLSVASSHLKHAAEPAGERMGGETAAQILQKAGYGRPSDPSVA